MLAAQTGAVTGTPGADAGDRPGPARCPRCTGRTTTTTGRGPTTTRRPRNRRRWLWLVAALLVLLLVGGGTALLLNQGDATDGGRTADPTGTSASSSAPAAGVALLPAADYVGGTPTR